MSDALTPPFLLAALVLCVAGAAKLRAPAGAARAAAVLGLPVGTLLIRGLALGELALGCICMAQPSRTAAAVLGALYLVFAVLSVMLARRRSECGCFGDAQSPASGFQALLSGALALGALAALGAVPHNLAWLFARSPTETIVLSGGISAAVYGTVLAYTKLPQAWAAWSGT